MSTVLSISLILLSSTLASSVNVFSGIAYLIVNFWVIGLKSSNVSTCFFLVLPLFLFIFQMLYQEGNI